MSANGDSFQDAVDEAFAESDVAGSDRVDPPDTGGGGGGGGGGNDRLRREERFAARTGQLDELAKRRAGQGGPDVDLGDVTRQDRRAAGGGGRDPAPRATDAPTVMEIGANLGRTVNDVGRTIDSGRELVTDTLDPVVPDREPRDPGGISARQIEAQLDAAESRQTTAEQFDTIVADNPDSTAQQTLNTVARGVDTATENPRATTAAISASTGSPLAFESEAGVEAPAGLRDVTADADTTATFEDAAPVGLADARPATVSQDVRQGTQAPAVTGPGIEADPAIAEDLTSGGFLGPETEQDLQRASQQTSSAIQTGQRALGIGGRALTAPGRAGAAALGGDTDRAADILRNPTGIDAGTRQEIGESLASGDVGTALETTAEASTRNEVRGEQFAEGIFSTAQFANPAGAALLGESGAEAVEGTVANLPDQPGDTAATAGVLGAGLATAAADATAEQAQERPQFFAGQVAGGVAGSVFGGIALGRGARAVGRATRGVGDRVRTAGSVDVTDDVVSPEVQRFFDEDAPGGERFPSTTEPDLVEAGDPAAAVRRQSAETTPDVVRERFEAAGVTEGSDLAKALPGEPRGPRTGRAAQGIEAPEADSDLASAFETPGTSFGPEISPNFFRLDETPDSADLSLRPGLPTLGRSRPTGVIARTDVENPAARTTAAFGEELRESAGDTTALAVRQEFEGFDPVEEAEAQVPPEAEFADLGGSLRRNVARRLGIGSDFRVEVGGRRIPVRPVADPDAIETRGPRSPGELFADERGQVTPGLDVDLRPSRRSLDEFGERQAPVDRPFPTVSTGPASGGRSVGATPGVDGRTSGSQPPSPAGESGGLFGGGFSGVSVGEGSSGLFDEVGGGASGATSRPADSGTPSEGGPFGGSGGGLGVQSGPLSLPAPSETSAGSVTSTPTGAFSPPPAAEVGVLPEPGGRPRRFDGTFDETDREAFNLDQTGRATPEFRNPIAQLFPGVDF